MLLRVLLTAIGLAAWTGLAQEVTPVPSTFSASISNWGGHAYTVELHDGSLFYSDASAQSKSAPKPTKIIPTAKQWRAFRRALDGIDVWAWHKDYEPNEVIFDGTHWSLSIRYPDRSLITSGGHCYQQA